MLLRPTLRGQPLAVLVLLVGGWVTLRAVTWQPPSWAADFNRQHRIALAVQPASAPGLAAASQQQIVEQPLAGGMSFPALSPVYGQGGWQLPWFGPQAQAPMQTPEYAPQPRPQIILREAPYTLAVDDRSSGSGTEPLLAAGHQLMWMAALARLAVPPEISQYIGGQTSPAAPAPVPLSPGLAATSGTIPNRWSADAWMLMRKQAPMRVADARPLYGGSQVGAVLRYQLAPASDHRPIAYLRGSSSMGMIRESEAALGLAARPIGSIPVMVGAEARAFDSWGKTSFRPAVIAYTELQPIELPMGLRADSYFQTGYVGGRFKTPFVDGQVRVDRPVGSMGKMGLGDIRVGAGVWGGAQKGASRLDAGPGATASLKLMGRPARVSMDYRFRILGDADPGSGPAVTVAAGF